MTTYKVYTRAENNVKAKHMVEYEGPSLEEAVRKHDQMVRIIRRGWPITNITIQKEEDNVISYLQLTQVKGLDS